MVQENPAFCFSYSEGTSSHVLCLALRLLSPAEFPMCFLFPCCSLSKLFVSFCPALRSPSWLCESLCVQFIRFSSLVLYSLFLCLSLAYESAFGSFPACSTQPIMTLFIPAFQRALLPL